MRFMWKNIKYLLLLLSLAFNINLCFSDTNTSKSETALNQISIEENILNTKKTSDDLLDALDDYGREIHLNSQTRYYDCLKVVGNIKFCKCLRKELPYVLTFNDYVIIMTTEKNVLLATEKQKSKDEISSMSRVIDKTINVRNICVNQ